MAAHHLTVGRQAEDLACRYLTEHNFRILERNWRRPWGELDIIARMGRTLHFVEVKGERTSAAGFEAYRRADARKLHKVIRTAKTWLSRRGYQAQTPWQIDVIAVTIDSRGQQAHITHFKNVIA